jgi:hypothetical protein
VDQLDSASQLLYNGLDFNWAQVILFQGAPDLKLDGSLFDIFGYQNFRRDKDHPFSRLEIVPNGGRLILLVGQWYEDAEVNQQGGPSLGAQNTSINELDSGPIAIAAGEVRPIILANPNRIRGVTVQNVGTTVIALSKTGIGAALATASLLLAPGAAANDGNGDVATFDGWQGSIFAANVAGGPGSVLVSAF